MNSAGILVGGIVPALFLGLGTVLMRSSIAAGGQSGHPPAIQKRIYGTARTAQSRQAIASLWSQKRRRHAGRVR
jgi:hypothetical protein